MTAVSITDDMLARVRELLENEQPNLTLRSVCQAFNQEIGTPLVASESPFGVSAEGMVWGVLHYIAPGLVIFENTARFGILRRTRTTVSEAVFLVTWITKSEQSQGSSVPMMWWATIESNASKAHCLIETTCLSMPSGTWEEARRWLDKTLPAPPL